VAASSLLDFASRIAKPDQLLAGTVQPLGKRVTGDLFNYKLIVIYCQSSPIKSPWHQARGFALLTTQR
jgi:hypothetical protein